MKVLVTQDFLATRSTASKSCLSILEPAGPRLPPSQPCLEVLANKIVAQNFFCFTYFHGLSAASPLGWALRMTSGKVRLLHVGYSEGLGQQRGIALPNCIGKR
jgi:hypothetical protein